MQKLLVALVSLLAFGLAHAADKPCTPADSSAAEKAADRVVEWEQLYKAYKDYGHCDQGPVADVFTDALLRCLVEWKHVEGLATPMESDSGYRGFVQRHLKVATKPDQDAVYSRAKMSCPKGLDPFCTDIANAARPMAQFQQLQLAPSPGTEPPKK